jgi:ABC-2 type transport system permease protein
MIQKYLASTFKELLLLSRDKAGLAMLFIMPMALILIMTLLQNSTFQQLEEKKLPVLIINYDADTFGIEIVNGLKKAKFFKVDELNSEDANSENNLIKQVESGEYQIGIVIRKNATALLRNKIKENIQSQFPKEEDDLFVIDSVLSKQLPKVDIYFDPAIKNSFKQSIISALRRFSAAVEASVIFDIYSGVFHDLLDIEMKKQNSFSELVEFNENYANSDRNRVIPNAVQHNVPAWTIFAMFFIVIPLAGNIIKERESGISSRLKTMPGSNLPVILGKASVYFMVGILQAVFMLLIGIYILPLFGLPALKLGSQILALIIVAMSVSLAASGYGIVIGTIATTQEQSSIFGSISVVILAALGGVWVPNFMMSDLMNTVSKLSPLNWGLNGFYDVFLRNEGVLDILPYIISLLLFFLACILTAFLYNSFKKRLS